MPSNLDRPISRAPDATLVDASNAKMFALVGSFNKLVSVTTLLSLITKNTVGLSNVDNTSDANKPLSIVAVTALNNLSTALTNHLNANNPHNVTKSTIGLGNVDNTSDLNKPLSTLAAAANAAIEAKIAVSGQTDSIGVLVASLLSRLNGLINDIEVNDGSTPIGTHVENLLTAMGSFDASVIQSILNSITSLNTLTSSHSTQIVGINNKIVVGDNTTNIGVHVDNLLTQISGVLASITTIQGALNTHGNTLASQASTLNSHDTTLSSHAVTLYNNTNTINSHTSSINQHTTDIASLVTSLATASQTITTHSTTLLTHGSAITALDNRVTVLEDDLANLVIPDQGTAFDGLPVIPMPIALAPINTAHAGGNTLAFTMIVKSNMIIKDISVNGSEPITAGKTFVMDVTIDGESVFNTPITINEGESETQSPTWSFSNNIYSPINGMNLINVPAGSRLSGTVVTGGGLLNPVMWLEWFYSSPSDAYHVYSGGNYY